MCEFDFKKLDFSKAEPLKIDEIGMWEFDFKKLDFSKAEPLKIDEIENAEFNKLVDKIVEEYGKQYAEFKDKAVFKSAVMKAKLYDLNCNEYTVTERVKKEAVTNFCKWLLENIEEEKLSKKDIINMLKGRATND